MQEEQIRLQGRICEDQALVEGGGHAVRVTIIQGGRSQNGYVYPPQALQSIARLVEGAQAYADHGVEGTGPRSVRDMVGFYHQVSYIPPSATVPRGRVDATLHILAAAHWLWSVIQEACQLGRPELIGLSVDIMAHWQVQATTGDREVTGVLALNSCDIVTRPSAGGAIQRVLHHDDAAPSASASDSVCSISISDMHRDQQGVYMDDTNTTPQVETPQRNDVMPQPPATDINMSQVFEQQQSLDQLLERIRLERASLTLERRLAESPLPQAVKEQIAQRYRGRTFEERDLDQEMASARTMMAKLAQDGLVRGNSYAKLEIGMQITEAEKIQAAFDGMLGLDIDSGKFGNLRGFTSVREAYARVTGDHSLASGISTRSVLGSIHIAESAPVGRISEADVTTASFSYLLGTSMNKRLLQDYQAWPADWQKLVSIVGIRDFKQQARVRLGAFGTLPVVAENSAYAAVALTDSAAAYVPQKRGNLVTISRETIINDDLQAIRQIPTKLAVAAAYTLAEFVYGFLSSNAIIYDGSALFTTGAPHTNLGNTALSSSSLQAGVSAMRVQSNFAGKRLGLRPRFLVVPPELEWTSMILTQSASVPGSANNDINPMQGYVTPIVAPQLSSATQWFLVADPREIDTIEIGFVGGETNPTLFVQDQPLVGLNFSQDAITYKIRHEYGGAVVDYRGLYRGN